MCNRLVALLACLVMILGACDSPPPSPAPFKKHLSAEPLTGPKEIVPGVGAKGFRIGMSEADVIAIKAPSKVIELEITPDTKWLDYQEDGMQLVYEEGQVSGVIVYFRSREHQPFEGETKEGIGVQSSIRDVICTYGQPTSMSKTRGVKVGKYDEWAGGIQVGLTYMERGILFGFVNEQLVHVTIAPERKDYDPGWQQDIGDVAEYRNIVCDTE